MPLFSCCTSSPGLQLCIRNVVAEQCGDEVANVVFNGLANFHFGMQCPIVMDEERELDDQKKKRRGWRLIAVSLWILVNVFRFSLANE